MNVNKAIIVGRLGVKPELRYTPKGTAVTTLSVATSDRDRKTNWHNITAFGQPAEFICKYGDKGLTVYIEGSIEQRSWDDKKTGEKRYKTEIVAYSLELMNYMQGNPPPEQQNAHAEGDSDL